MASSGAWLTTSWVSTLRLPWLRAQPSRFRAIFSTSEVLAPGSPRARPRRFASSFLFLLSLGFGDSGPCSSLVSSPWSLSRALTSWDSVPGSWGPSASGPASSGSHAGAWGAEVQGWDGVSGTSSAPLPAPARLADHCGDGPISPGAFPQDVKREGIKLQGCSQLSLRC